MIKMNKILTLKNLRIFKKLKKRIYIIY